MKKTIVKFIFVLILISLSYAIYRFVYEPYNTRIKSFEIRKISSGNAVFEDYSATITNDSVKLFVPYLVDFNLQAEFIVAKGAKVYCNGKMLISGRSTVDYKTPQQLKVVSSNGKERIYTVCIYNSGLPVVFLTTKHARAINDKEKWLKETHFTVYNADGTIDYDAYPELAKVKGRGNSTWSHAREKRSCVVKLDTSSSILGMPEDRRWVLVSNYYDVTFFRNEVSNYITRKFTNQEWVPRGYNVELVQNGTYKGNYYISEHPRIHKNRIKAKYLLEADIKLGVINEKGAIEGSRSHNMFYIKSQLKRDSDDYQRISDVIEEFETALYDGNYSKVEQLIDMESFVEWFLIKEWSHDIDANMHTSCFFTISEDNKIKMGPVWDFDCAWGNNPFPRNGLDDSATAEFYTTTNPFSQPDGKTCTSWFGEFIKIPGFRKMLKEKVLYINSHMDEILAYIDENTEYLILSATASKVRYIPDDEIFASFGMSAGITLESYRQSMSDLKNYVKTRMEWFVKEVNKF